MCDGGSSGAASNRIAITELNINLVLYIVTWLLLAFNLAYAFFLALHKHHRQREKDPFAGRYASSICIGMFEWAEIFVIET